MKATIIIFVSCIIFLILILPKSDDSKIELLNNKMNLLNRKIDSLKMELFISNRIIIKQDSIIHEYELDIIKANKYINECNTFFGKIKDDYKSIKK